MDYKFPQQLFPGFYNTGPPLSDFKHYAGKWGSYEGVTPADVNVKGGSRHLSSWTFTPWHQAKAETWLPAEPAPLPLLSPKTNYPWPSTPPDSMDFPQHMQNFFQDHHQDAFCTMSRLLGENFNFTPGTKKKSEKNSVNMWKVKDFMARLKYKKCEYSYLSNTVNAYGGLLSDVIHDIPPALLADLLQEELTEQRDRLQFSECATGGALAYIPFTQSGSGCLLYPGNQGLDRLNFHRVALQDQGGGPSCLDARSNKPFSFQLKGPVRQISSASLLGDCCVAVRSDYLCGVWRFSETDEPRLLQVVQTGEPATCISTSPHVLGEVLVASESGAANLWTVGKGMQRFREEDSNLYFNARSPWRWCEFSAHPRVMLYADRTGVELTDVRTKPGFSHTLFRISHTSECRSGERIILSRYLGHAHSFHHLITTQYSAYIMDERFPCMPMLKWDHMMQYPPMFGHVLPGPASSVVGGVSTTKVLLGSQSSQEITMFQYSGGRAEACVSRGPPQALLRPRDSLKHLPVQIPHRLDTAHNRLALPAAGLTCIQTTGGGGGEDCICVLQLTEAGDIFYQILKPQQPQIDSPRPPMQEEAPPPLHGADHNRPQPIIQQDSAGRPSRTRDRFLARQLTSSQASTMKSQPTLMETTASGGKTTQDKMVKLPVPDSEQIISDSSSNEDVIGPTQGPGVQRSVPETPEREQQLLDRIVLDGWDSSSEDSELEGRCRDLKCWGMEVVVNDEPELDQTGLSNTEVKDKHVADNDVDDSEEPAVLQHAEENGSNTSWSRINPSPVKLSDDALVTWKHWLKKLMQKSRDSKPRPHCLQHYTIKTKHLLNLHGNRRRDPMEEDRLQSLSRDLRECMTKSSLLVHGATNLRALEAVPVPNPVDTGAWLDELSQRLTVSWQGDEEWKSWWDERLGLNQEEKMEALRRKRRRQKAARAGRRLELRGSFTSSVSYQSELGDLSDPMGWSSAASQGEWSDTDGFLSRLDMSSEPGTPRATTPSAMVTTPTDTSQQPQRQQMLSPSLSQTLWPDSTPAAILPERKIRRPSEDYLSSLFASQESLEPQQSYFLEEVNIMDTELLAVASSSQLPGSQSVLQRSLRGAPEEPHLSQGALSMMGFSQSLSLSQASQGRLRLSQSSQPKRKKSRMGF